MILPTKHITLNKSLLGVGGLLLGHLAKPRTLTSLWETVKDHPDIVTYERFILSLDFLYIIGAVDLRDGLLRRCGNDSLSTL